MDSKCEILFILLMILCITKKVNCNKEEMTLTAYQCTIRDDMSNVEVYDINSVEKCPMPPKPDELEQKLIQVVQRVDIVEIEVLRCKVHLRAESWRCGMHDHSVDPRTHFNKLIDQTKEHCLELYRTGFFSSDKSRTIVHNQELNRGKTTMFTWKMVGDTDHEGNCWNSESIKDPETGEDLPDRILKYYYAVLIEKTKANIINGNLVLPNNRIEKVMKSDEFVLEKTKGFDEEFGTWVITSTLDCLSQYQEIYYGHAWSPKVLEPKSNIVINSTAAQNLQIGVIKLKEETHICHEKSSFQTFFKRISVIELAFSSERLDIKKIHPLNVGINDLVGSATNYVLYNNRKDIQEVYRNLTSEDCHNERQDIRVKLAMTKANPAHANLLFDTPGVLAVVMGDIVAFTKCDRVSVQLRETLPSCYADLPVKFNGKDFYRQSDTLILVNTSSRIDCQTEIKYFRLNEKFYVRQTKNGFVKYNRTVMVQKTKEREYNLYEDLLPFSMGSLFGDAANYIQNAIIMQFERITASRMSENFFIPVTGVGQGISTMLVDSMNSFFGNLFEGFRMWWERTFLQLSLGVTGFFYGILVIVFTLWFGTVTIRLFFGSKWKLLWSFLSIFAMIYYFFKFFFNLFNPEDAPTDYADFKRRVVFKLKKKSDPENNQEGIELDEKDLKREDMQKMYPNLFLVNGNAN